MVFHTWLELHHAYRPILRSLFLRDKPARVMFVFASSIEAAVGNKLASRPTFEYSLFPWTFEIIVAREFSRVFVSANPARRGAASPRTVQFHDARWRDKG